LKPKRNKKNLIENKYNHLYIDGNSLFKTSYHGSKDEYNKFGEHVGGIYQFFTMLRKMLNEDIYHKVIILWDGKFSGKLRYQIYKDYKSNRLKDWETGIRVDEDKNLIVQQYIIKEYIEEIGIRQYEDDIVEADDLIAYLVSKNKKNNNITIVTNDRDLCQLIDTNVRVYLTGLKKYMTTETHPVFFDYHYKNTSLIKTICGDSSDTIKGIKGVGEKTLLSFFPELYENILDVDYIIDKAKKLQDERISNKQKPLKSLNNIINAVCDGSQKSRVYEINEKIINLEKPLLTEESLKNIDSISEKFINFDDRSIKNLYMKFKRDGLNYIIRENNIVDFLTPFKKLIQREKLINN
jgi:5'-3' exonuclease